MKTRNEFATELSELTDISKDTKEYPMKTAADWDVMAKRLRDCLSFATKAKATLTRAESL